MPGNSISDYLPSTKNSDGPVFVCSGNHDLDEFAECDWLTSMKSKKVCVDGQIISFCGIKFGCVPYLGADLSYFSGCNVILSHVPPIKTTTSQSIIAGILRDCGDEGLFNALKERVISPQYILCGHVKNPSANRDCLFGVEIINPGAQHNSFAPKHKIILI